ncbi:MAG: hypothetical protein HWE13_13275 [Gammaproteobacteria bacterium]|nr:hypothetical protein [Gammaproteobacteria bacterium]
MKKYYWMVLVVLLAGIAVFSLRLPPKKATSEPQITTPLSVQKQSVTVIEPKRSADKGSSESVAVVKENASINDCDPVEFEVQKQRYIKLLAEDSVVESAISSINSDASAVLAATFIGSEESAEEILARIQELYKMRDQTEFSMIVDRKIILLCSETPELCDEAQLRTIAASHSGDGSFNLSLFHYYNRTQQPDLAEAELESLAGANFMSDWWGPNVALANRVLNQLGYHHSGLNIEAGARIGTIDLPEFGALKAFCEQPRRAELCRSALESWKQHAPNLLEMTIANHLHSQLTGTADPEYQSQIDELQMESTDLLIQDTELAEIYLAEVGRLGERKAMPLINRAAQERTSSEGYQPCELSLE